MIGDFRTKMILALLVLSLGGCGIKGGLQDPPTEDEQIAEEQQRKERDEGWWERLLP